MVSFSVIIITHGREEQLMKCLDSLQPPVSHWQLIILGNGVELSSVIKDKALSLTANFTELHSEVQLTPGKARNLALLSADQDWIYFIDDDAHVLPGYWDIVLPLLCESKIDVLGGPDSPAKGMGSLAMSLAITLSSPFCTGMTFARHKGLGQKLQAADEEKLTSCNLWVRRSEVSDVTFPEDYLRAEETLFLQKLKMNGLGMYYHPKLKVGHFRRKRLSELFRPTFYAGFYRSKLMRDSKASDDVAFWLPSFFVLLHLLIFLDPVSFWSLVRLYLGIISFVSFGLAVRAKKFWLFPLIVFLHYFVVFMYGIGFLVERIRRKNNSKI